MDTEIYIKKNKLHTSLSVSLCLSLSLSVSLCLSVSLSVSLSLSLSLSLCLSVSLSLSLSVSLSLPPSLSLSPSLPPSLSLYIYIYLSINYTQLSSYFIVMVSMTKFKLFKFTTFTIKAKGNFLIHKNRVYFFLLI